MGQPAEIYAKQLSSYSYGYPLWFPDAISTAGEPQLGDVGYINNGRFLRLFNITVGPGHPWNRRYGVPHNFTPLCLPEEYTLDEPRYLTPNLFQSRSVKTTRTAAQLAIEGPAYAQLGLSFQFECANNHGAFLALHRTAGRKSILNTSTLEAYISRKHRTWHDFTTDRGLKCQPSDVICLSGWVKTSEWTVAAFLKDEQGFACSVQGQITPSATIGCNVCVTESREMSVIYHSGPERIVPPSSSDPSIPSTSSTPPTEKADQTIFIEFYKVRYRKFVAPKAFKAAAGPHHLPDPYQDTEDAAPVSASDHSSDESLDLEMVPSRIAPNTPLDDVLDYLLEGPLPEDLPAFLRNSAVKVTLPQSVEKVVKLARISGASESDHMDLDSNLHAGFLPHAQHLSGMQSSSTAAVQDSQLVEQDCAISDICDVDVFPSSVPEASTGQLQNVEQGMRSPLYREVVQLKEHHEEEAGFRELDRKGVTTEQIKMKPLGACARCKLLKMKCDFRGNADVCRRCSATGHECIVPGQVTRKPPQKREHLLSTVYQQAEEIKRLKAQLEEVNRKIPEAEAHEQYAPSLCYTATTDSSPEVEGSDSLSVSSCAVDIVDSEMGDWLDDKQWVPDAYEMSHDMSYMGGKVTMLEMLMEESEEEEDTGDGPSLEVADEVEIEVKREAEEIKVSRTDEGSNVKKHIRLRSAVSGGDQSMEIASDMAPFGLFGKQELHEDRSSWHMKHEDEVVMLDDSRFAGGPAVERPIDDSYRLPPILRDGLITPVEGEKLFQIFLDYMNPSLNLLDPELYTSQTTFWRSPFLFTVVCGTASRYYASRPQLYQHAMHYAKLAAGVSLIQDEKNIETVQAYLLLSLYPVPSRKWEDERSWIYLGTAIRVATSLNLQYPVDAKSSDKLHPREILNRTRTWLNCYNLDRSMGSQYGKATIIDNSDYVANHSDQWWNSSSYNLKGSDIHIAACTAALTVLGRFRAKVHNDTSNPTGFNKHLDMASFAAETDDELTRLWEVWMARIHEHADVDDLRTNFRTGLLRLNYSYARMSVLSFGFQYAFGKQSMAQDLMLLQRCLHAATDVLNVVLQDIAIADQKIFLKHGPEPQSVFVTFACSFLIKLLHPKYNSYIGEDKRIEIRERVTQIVGLFSSPEVAIDDRHGPKLYARFLQRLLETPEVTLDWQRTGAKSRPPATRKLHGPLAVTPPRQSMSELDSASMSAEPEYRQQSEVEGPYRTANSIRVIDPSSMSIDGYDPYDSVARLLPYDDSLHALQCAGYQEEGSVPGFTWMNSLDDFSMS
ncbi:hypothetical protein NM688_g3138 [Phlebia brevispora]|uniref:Uncharacterized protein n=1 Tax=Phlebia brevispora TaxID=194682 RepID=A0ACC1T6T2_9APHY|nr:hypothetical protein NM688_g3138 [Phlebia brevispora]